MTDKITPPEGIATYKTSDGLEFWMEDKIAAALFVAPTIRTTYPNISIVMAPTNKDRTDVYLFRYYQQVFSFLTPSPARSLHDSSYEDLRERNSHLNLAIDSFGESVEWSEIIVDPISGSPKRKYSPVQVSKSFSSFEEQKVVMGLFCELLAWACDGSLAMIRGGYLISKAEFVKKNVGFDHDLRKRFERGEFVK